MDAELRARIERRVISTWPLVTVDRGDLLALLAAYDEAVARIAKLEEAYAAVFGTLDT